MIRERAQIAPILCSPCHVILATSPLYSSPQDNPLRAIAPESNTAKIRIPDSSFHSATAYSTLRGLSIRLEASRISNPTMFPSLS